MMKKLLPIFMLCIGFSLFSQNAREVFAPFVSIKNVTAENGAIKLTWRASTDIDGSYIIYRHTEEITSSNFSEAVRVGTADKGSVSFVDYPEEDGSYFYSVLIKNDSGKVYELFIPFRNKTTKAVVFEKSAAVEGDLLVRDIETQVQRDAVYVSFSAPDGSRELIIYRSTSPIVKSTDLAYAQPLRIISGSRSSFQDFPVPGISYYYAVLDSDLAKAGDITFKPGDNATIIPASIPVGYRIGLPETTVSRNLPLPLLPLSLQIASGEELSTPRPMPIPKPKELDPATSKALSSFMKLIPESAPPAMKPVVLAEDAGSIVSGGEEYTLKSIINGEFAEKRWLEAEKLLKNFLSVHRSPSIERRANFYLGQALYFQKKYQDAFMQFILVRDDMYTEATPWIDRLFSLLIEI